MTEGWVDYLTGPYGLIFAFAAGMLSFLSPCCLPLVPAYLAHLTGTTSTYTELRARHRETATHAVAFVLGFTAVFTVLGASVGLIGAISTDSSYAVTDFADDYLRYAAGVLLIVLGLNVIGIIRIPVLYRTMTLETATAGVPQVAGASGGGATMTAGDGSGAAIMAAGAGGSWPGGLNYVKSFGVGSAFAIGWTPCIGPVLGAILTLSATSADVAQGSYLLLVYSLGLGLPFIITGFAAASVMSFLRRIRWLMPVVEIVMGVIVIFVGALIFLDELTIFNKYFDFFGLSGI